MKKKKDKSKYLTKYVGITEQPVECPQQILANYGHTSWKDFKMLLLFLRFSGFPGLSSKVFLITFKFS